MDAKVYCLDPVEIVNPQLVGFILSSEKVWYNDTNLGLNEYRLPHLILNGTTKDVKATLRSRLRRWLRHAPYVNYFMNSDGVCMDARIKVPCGHCLLCMERKKKSFAAKCIMETQLHEYLPLFLTMTYDDNHLPENGVNYREIQLFLKRVRINLKRLGYDVELKYAVGSEYGDPNKTFRPHYHMLIWGFPRTGMFWNLNNIWHHLYDCWTDNNGVHKCIPKCFILKQCSDSNAAYYVGKYMSKHSRIPEGCNAPTHRTSINLGVDFVMDKAAGVLRANPEYTEVSYCDRFTGKVCKIPMVKYFIDKVFPTYSSVPVEQRNALRDYHLSLDNREFECNSNLPLLDTEVDAFRDTTHDYGKLRNALEVLKGTENKVYPDFQANKVKRDMYYMHLFDNLGDIDLEHIAYKLTKKQAKDKDKEVF